jgi:cob(I)alamin adenosyltransferase
MKIYTKTGDQGMTGLYGGARVSKFDMRIESYGTLDELNSYIGLIRDQEIDKHCFETLVKIQGELFSIGAILATPEEYASAQKKNNFSPVSETIPENTRYLEKEIDAMNLDLPAMTHFVLPGGHTSVSTCHIARCVCRRAERMVVQLATEIEVDAAILSYLNRLSDYLFVLARKLAFDCKVDEIKWIP